MRRVVIDCATFNNQDGLSTLISLFSLNVHEIHSYEDLSQALLEIKENILIEVYNASKKYNELLDCLESIQQKSNTIFLTRGPK